MHVTEYKLCVQKTRKFLEEPLLYTFHIFPGMHSSEIDFKCYNVKPNSNILHQKWFEYFKKHKGNQCKSLTKRYLFDDNQV